MAGGPDRIIVRDDACEAAFLACDALLSVAMRDFLADLMLIDATPLVHDVLEERQANLNDLLQSAGEFAPMFLKVEYGGRAVVTLEWSAPPQVEIDCELAGADFRLYTTVHLGPGAARLQCRGLLWRGSGDTLEEHMASLEASLAGL